MCHISNIKVYITLTKIKHQCLSNKLGFFNETLMFLKNIQQKIVVVNIDFFEYDLNVVFL